MKLVVRGTQRLLSNIWKGGRAVAAMLLALCVWMPLNFASARAADCTRFQNGPLRERQIFKSVGLEALYQVIYAPLKIHYLYDYLLLPEVKGSGNREPETTELFVLNTESGAPVRHSGGEVIPEDRPRSMRILVDGNSWSHVWQRLLSPEVIVTQVFDKQLPLRAGQALVNPVRFRYSDRRIAEFREIKRTDEIIDTTGELYALPDKQGEISDILLCDAAGDIPFPVCDLTSRTDQFIYKATFFRAQLGNLPAIRLNAKEFVICLTQGFK